MLKKTLRTMWKEKGEYISMIIMIFLGIFIYSGINAEWYGLQYEGDKLYEKTNLSDAFLLSEGFIDDTVYNDLKSEKLDIEKRTIMDVGIQNTKKVIQLNVVYENKISTPYYIDGKKFDINQDGIWLHDRFASLNDIKINDTVIMVLDGMVLNKTVVGLVKGPEYAYYVSSENQLIPDFTNNGYAYISYKYSPSPIYNRILIKSNLSKEELLDYTKTKGILVMKDDMMSYQTLKSEIEGNKAISILFPVVFLLIASLSMITTLSRLTTKESVIIGTLKASGYNSKQLIMHYLSYGFIVFSIGAILGLILGPYIIGKYMIDFQSTMYDLPHFKVRVPIETYFVILGMFLILVLINYLSIKKILKMPIRESLRPLAPKKYFKSKNKNKIKTNKYLSFYTSWNLRDIKRNPLRSIMSIIGVLGATVMIIASFAMQNAFKDVSKVMYEDLCNYDYKIAVNQNATEEQIEDFKDSINGEASASLQILLSDYKSYSLSIYDTKELILFKNQNGDYVNLSNDGVYITRKIASKYSLSENDSISFELINGKIINSVINDIIESPMNQGLILSVSSAKKLNISYKLDSIYSNILPTNNTLVDSILTKDDLIDSLNSVLEGVSSIVYVMIIGAIVLTIVVLYNLGMMSFIERFRELSTLKVLGFQDKQINHLLTQENIILTISGLIIGLPLGYFFSIAMVKLMPESMDIKINIHGFEFVFAILIVFVTSFLVSLLIRRKTKQLDMVESLKLIE